MKSIHKYSQYSLLSLSLTLSLCLVKLPTVAQVGLFLPSLSKPGTAETPLGPAHYPKESGKCKPRTRAERFTGSP